MQKFKLVTCILIAKYYIEVGNVFFFGGGGGYPVLITNMPIGSVYSYLLSFIVDIDLHGGCLHSKVSRVFFCHMFEHM